MKEWSTLKKLIWLKGAKVIGAAGEVWKTISNAAIATFTAIVSPLRQLVVAIEPVQNLNGYANPWPAGGGKNLVNAVDGQGSHANATVTNNGARIDLQATTTIGYNAFVLNASEFVGKGDYYMSFDAYRTGGSQNSVSCNGAYKLNGSTKYDGITGSRLYVNDEAHIVDLVVNFPEGATNAVINLYINNYPTTVEGQTGHFDNLRICKEQNQPFSPYSNICPITGWTEAKVWVKSTHDTSSSPTVTIDLNGTRYGGTLDVLTGVLTVNKVLVDGGSLTWTKVTGNNYCNFNATPNPAAIYVENRATIISSQYVGECNNTAPKNGDNYVWIRSGAIAVKDTSKAALTENEFKTAMTGVQFVYELANTLTVQLTPQQVSSLLGANNVWADTGNVTVEYRES